MRVSHQSDVSDYTASSVLCWPLLKHLRRREIDLRPLLEQEGLSFSKLVAPNARIRLDELQRLFRAAGRAADDDAIGVRVVSEIDPLATASWAAPFSFIEGIYRTSATLRDAIERERPYLRLLRDGLMVSVDEWSADKFIVRWEFTAPENEPAELLDCHLALGLALSQRTLKDRDSRPVETWFTRRAPRDLAPYRETFGHELRFSADCNALIVPASTLLRPIATHDPVTLQVFEYQGRALMEQLPSLEDFVARVREHIESELPNGNTTAARVAHKLAISGRTLHRRLRSHGTTYQEQLDQVRYRLAMRYLASRRYPLGQVASLVGFAQQSAFQRAFKTWAGQTPAEYQQYGANGSPRRSHVAGSATT